MKAAIYARVSTADQTCENQLLELRRYAEARGWTAMREYVDEGVSGAKERRPRAGCVGEGCEAATGRCRRVLASGSSWAQSSPSRDAAR